MTINYKSFLILKSEQGYQVLSPNGWDIVGQYLNSLKLAKSCVNDYMQSEGLQTEKELFGNSPLKIALPQIFNK